ncbi:hypothetical protein [Rhizobium terrae]|uniref:hypothetical protein n=1 Tax=Rhizobium terrae TaxID=2171756 RepID=UPI000E3D7E46|nr:hypothetical protein [Rhizobium terrae]
MLSRVSERKMLSVRALLLIAWLTLIASLFWDPYSASLTRPDNLLSPFRIMDSVVMVQEQALTATPYSLGARIFWTMVVPLVPLFLMVFGHEAWRRICPLSLASQIPGYMGLRRYRSKLERRTGLITRKVALISPTGWLARHNWYVQFSMLFTGVTVRLLIINTDRHALGIALLSVICMAMMTGLLWGGKTWCNYFCPANVVQKIYTEPGGLLESTPHFSRPAVPQSMCRKPSPKGDVSACVACTANCGDIDLQRSYWNAILEPQRRNVYYMFLGLILGFYGYYYIYAGNWNYYFSGIWTHEDGITQKLLDQGVHLLGGLFVIPKIIAAPLVLALFCAFGLAVGRSLEAVYRRLRAHQDGMSEQVVVHHCLSVSAWASINAFYLFGGRPNIMLMPALGERLIDILIVSLTTLWLRKALQQSPTRYQHESMASNLLAELEKLKVNVSQFLDGRKLESLKPDEMYLLTKVLPGFSKQQKLDAYRKILDEAVSRGSTASQASFKVLQDFRSQMNVTEEEHMALLEELGLAHIAEVDTADISEEEKAESLNHYRGIINNLVADRIQSGMSIQDILVESNFQSTVNVLRQSLQISDAAHELVVAEFLSPHGIVSIKMEEVLERLVCQKSVRLCIEAARISDSLGLALQELLQESMEAHEQAIRIEALLILRNFSPESHAKLLAEDLASLCERDLDPIMRRSLPSNPAMRWRNVLHPDIVAILLGRSTVADGQDSPAAVRRTNRKVLLDSANTETSLMQLMVFDDHLIRAIGLMLFGYIDTDIARDTARMMIEDLSDADHPLLSDVVKFMAALPVVEDGRTGRTMLRAAIQTSEETDKNSRFEVHPVIKLAMLACSDMLRHLPLSTLADIAYQSRVERYERDARLEAASPLKWNFLVYRGEVCLFDPATMKFLPQVVFGPGDIVGVDLAGRSSALTPKIASDFAIVLQVPHRPDVAALISSLDIVEPGKRDPATDEDHRYVTERADA